MRTQEDVRVAGWTTQSGSGHAGTVEVDLLDGFEMRRGGARIGPRDLGGTKPRLILELLLLRRGTAVSKDMLVEHLWGSAPGGSHANLETYVCVLRRRLHDRLALEDGLIRTVASGYVLDASRVVTDVDRLHAGLERVLDPEMSPSLAAQLLGGGSRGVGTLLLGEPDLPWVQAARSAHAVRTAGLLVEAGQRILGSAPAVAEKCARAAIEVDELNEQAWHVYLVSLRDQGRPAEAIHAYGRLRSLLSEQLGCSPRADIRAVYEDLLRATGEDDSDLGLLLDALIRVHRAASAPAPVAAGTAGAPGVVASTSVEAARRALLAFLGTAGTARPQARTA